MSALRRPFAIGAFLLSCICGIAAQHMYDCSNVLCTSNQTCSTYDGECYDRFTTNHFDFSYYDGGLTFACDDINQTINADISAIFDRDNTTYYKYDKGIMRMINITFSEPVWVHAITILMNRDTSDIYVVNDDFSTLNDACEEGEFWRPFTITSHSYYGGYGVAKFDNESYFNDVVGQQFPIKTQSLGIIMLNSKNVFIYGLDVYGIAQTPAPTNEPTLQPTSPTSFPTDEPTFNPSTSPTTQPTEYPTDPGICTAYPNVTQSCCGFFNHSVEEQRVNIRNPSLSTCYYTFIDSCCGTEGTYEWDNSGMEARCYSDWTDATSDNDTLLNAVFCDPDDYDVSQKDDVYGTMIAGSFLNFSSDLSTCNCMYAVYECNGTDEATCRGDDLCDDLFDEDCWNSDSDTDIAMSSTMVWDYCETDWFSNETCYTESVEDNWAYSSLLWEPCSTDSFIGQVWEVGLATISNESLDVSGDVCECTYTVVDCRLTSDPASEKGSCDDHDCDSGGCYEQEVRPCCGFDRTDRFNHSFNIVSPQFDDYGYPIDDTWTCDNGVDELCPDVRNGTRLYNATSRVGWFYNGSDIVDQCTCLYFYDECDLPTVSPTPNPTVIPTEEPTSKPTEIDSNEDPVDGSRGVVLGVTIMVVMISFASVYVV